MSEAPIHTFYKQLLKKSSQPIFIQTKPSATPNNTPDTSSTSCLLNQAGLLIPTNRRLERQKLANSPNTQACTTGLNLENYGIKKTPSIQSSSPNSTISESHKAIKESLESYVDVIEENVQLYDELQTAVFEKESCHSKELIERILDIQEDIVRMNFELRVLLQEIHSGEPIRPSEREPRATMTAEQKMAATLQYIGYYMLHSRNEEDSMSHRRLTP